MINPTRPLRMIVSIITLAAFLLPFAVATYTDGHVVNITGLRLSLGPNPGSKNASPELEAGQFDREPYALVALIFALIILVTSVVRKILGALLGTAAGMFGIVFLFVLIYNMLVDAGSGEFGLRNLAIAYGYWIAAAGFFLSIASFPMAGRFSELSARKPGTRKKRGQGKPRY
jgi:hypothetical protein